MYGSKNTYLHNIICSRFFYDRAGECLRAVRPESSGKIRVIVSLQKVDITFHAALSGEFLRVHKINPHTS